MPADLPTPFLDSTTESRSRDLGSGASEIRLPGLTVLYHPDLARIGERALLSALEAGRSARLSRLEPAFATPGSDAEPGPLGHRRLSRRPLMLEGAGDGIRLDCGESRTEVVADGESVTGERLFEPTELEHGVVLLLGGRIVVLLHRLDPVHDLNLPRFGLVGESPSLVDVRRHIRQVADTTVPVLLRGESGTGKELVARALHESSSRRGPFLAVNMAAVPPSLAAAELFGAARGAFTGAERRRDGYFARAQGGTLFLDEVGEMPAEVQALLLRCLETGEIQPVGGEAPRRVDVRLVAATDSDLETAMNEGLFRVPLFHRLGSFQIFLPPLRERREDVGRLLAAFLHRELAAVDEEHRLAQDPPWLPSELVARLTAYEWPGNVRQLKNVTRQLVIANRGRDEVRMDEVLRRMLEPDETPGEAPAPSPSRPGAPPVPRKPADISDDELVAALSAARWRPHAAARALGIPRPSIYHLMEKCPRVRTAAELEAEDVEPARRHYGDDVAAMAAALEVSERALRRRLRQLGLL